MTDVPTGLPPVFRLGKQRGETEVDFRQVKRDRRRRRAAVAVLGILASPSGLQAASPVLREYRVELVDAEISRGLQHARVFWRCLEKNAEAVVSAALDQSVPAMEKRMKQRLNLL